MKGNNTKGMKMAAKERHRECENLAHLVIDKLWVRGEKNTFVNVAKISGVSRATLYNIASVKKRIEKLKTTKYRRLSDIEAQINFEQKVRERRLLNEISELKKKIREQEMQKQEMRRK